MFTYKTLDIGRRTLNVFILILSISLSACSTQSRFLKTIKPAPVRDIVILPVASQSYDVTAPIMIRVFLEKKLKKQGFKQVIDARLLDQTLRQMGFTKPEQIQEGNIRQIGQVVKARAVFQSTLIQFKQDLVRKTTSIEAEFKLIDVKTGRILWKERTALQEEGLTKIPLSERVDYTWTEKEIHDLTKTKAAQLPKRLVERALEKMPSPSELGEMLFKG